jgi:transcriptional regulator with XRE-family HTH domain
MKQKDLAHKAQITASMVSQILNGKRRPSWSIAQRLELATGISAVLWIDGQVDREYLKNNYRPGKADQKTDRASNDYERKEIVNG